MAKKDIHPHYFPKAQVSCACGSSFTVGDTKESLSVDICNKCHPFYTGEEKLIDTTGRVERFKTRRAKASEKPLKAAKKDKETKRVAAKKAK